MPCASWLGGPWSQERAQPRGRDRAHTPGRALCQDRPAACTGAHACPCAHRQCTRLHIYMCARMHTGARGTYIHTKGRTHMQTCAHARTCKPRGRTWVGTHMHTGVNVHSCARRHTHTQLQRHAHVSILMCTNINVCLCTRAHMCAQSHAHTNTRCAHMWTCMCTHDTHAHLCTPARAHTCTRMLHARTHMRRAQSILQREGPAL